MKAMAVLLGVSLACLVGWCLTGCGDGSDQLDSSDRKERIQGLRQYAKKGGDTVAEKVAQVVRTDDTMVAAEAVRSLGSMRASRSLEILKEVASGANEKRGAVRQEAVIQLGRQGGTAPLPVLREIIKIDPDPEVRAAAATSIAWLGSLADVALLVEVAENETDPIVQARAVGAVEHLIGMKFAYNPAAPQAEREKALRRVRARAVTAAADVMSARRKLKMMKTPDE